MNLYTNTKDAFVLKQRINGKFHNTFYNDLDLYKAKKERAKIRKAGGSAIILFNAS